MPARERRGRSQQELHATARVAGSPSRSAADGPAELACVDVAIACDAAPVRPKYCRSAAGGQGVKALVSLQLNAVKRKRHQVIT
jgi:hypothetical protein